MGEGGGSLRSRVYLHLEIEASIEIGNGSNLITAVTEIQKPPDIRHGFKYYQHLRSFV